jgi:SAM-dependent methyltransferase
MKDDRIKDRRWWEEYFTPGGGWESNGGRLQTRIFAEHFTDRIQLDQTIAFSILDVGCALGESIRHFAKVWPHATLHGIDFSTTAIARCKDELGKMAIFSVGDFVDIEGRYDIIYCSNVLEHFPDFDTKARQLAKHCNRLCILVPYKELRSRSPLVPNPTEHHQHTFLRNSFEFLVQERLAHSIKTHIFSCPGAWGWSLKTRIKEGIIKNLARMLLNRPCVLPPKQILYDIVVARQESGHIQRGAK